MRIMIVEDEQRARRGLHNLITMISDRYEVVSVAQNGRQAMEMIQSVKPDVVFTDIRMPYMDGLSLIKAIQALDLQVEIVIISAYEEFETARQAISLGVREYLIKPVTVEEMESVLMKLEKNRPEMEFTDIQQRFEAAHPNVIRALGIIEQSYSARIRQKDIAEGLGMSQEYFSYLFNRDVGESFPSYLKKYRIQVAQKLLSHSEMDRRDVPYSVGFSDTKYFNKAFKEVTGLSVTEFLKKNNKI